ncbi:RTA1 like protein, partial [Hysterangium stoloniferum]
YGYIPTFWICCTFVALFGLTTVIHIGQSLFIKPHMYWLIPTTALCGLGEVLGWSARLWSSKNPTNDNAYLMQITTTIISPVFLTAALYTILGLVIDKLGHQYSRLKPKTYLKAFVTADVLALVVQAAGGGLASTANTSTGSRLGSNIMLAGIFFQMAVMLCYTLLAFEVILRFYWQKPLIIAQVPASSTDKGVFKLATSMSRRMSLIILATAIATVLVFIRTFYRSVELSGGWNGKIIRTQVYFNVLDATPICLALFILNVLSPKFLLREEGREDGSII